MRIDNHMGGFRASTKLPKKQTRKSVTRGIKTQKPDPAISSSLNFEICHNDTFQKGKDPNLYRYTKLKKAAVVLAGKGVL